MEKNIIPFHLSIGCWIYDNHMQLSPGAIPHLGKCKWYKFLVIMSDEVEENFQSDKNLVLKVKMFLCIHKYVTKVHFQKAWPTAPNWIEPVVTVNENSEDFTKKQCQND